MNALRKYIGFIAAGVVILLLLAAVVVMTLRYRTGFVEVERELQSQQGRLQQLHRRDPFPSEENVTLLAAQEEQIRDAFQLLAERLSRGQFEARAVEPARVPSLVYQVVEDLKDAAAEAQVDVAPDMAFGFERYLEGQPPRAADVPRLTLQLQETEYLVQQLIAARVEAIEQVERTHFETAAPADARMRDMDEEWADDPYDMPPVTRRRIGARRDEPEARPVQAARPGENELYTREHYRLTVRGHENTLWDAVNRLTSSDLVIRVSEVQIRNLAAEPGRDRDRSRPTTVRPRITGYDIEEDDDWDRVRPGRDPRRPRDVRPGQEGAQLARPLTREERLVSGRDKVAAILRVDVYRFKNPTAKE